MTELEGAGPTGLPRRRARGFPVLSLPRCVEAVRAAGKYGMRHPRSAFAGYLGHRTPDSGPFKQKLAALRDFGLIEGGGDIVLTGLGRRLALPTDADDERSDLLEAFRSADVFWELYEQSAKGIDLDREHLAASAVHRIGIAARSRQQFVESFVESGEFVGLVDDVGPGRCRLISTEDARDEVVERSVLRSGTDVRSWASGPPTRSASPEAFQTDINISRPLHEGLVMFQLRLRAGLPPGLFPELQAVAEAVDRLAHGISASLVDLGRPATSEQSLEPEASE